MKFRPPTDNDWPVIWEIANQSVADVPGAGVQDEWLVNRRGFSEHGFQHHFVLTDHGSVLGYGSVERASDAPPDIYRIFVVTAPEHLQECGARIFDRAERKLMELSAVESRLVEYAEDHRLGSFLLARGYTEVREFQLDSGQQAVVLSKDYT
jgi:hypothetical protein|tara:strand:+ start:245 stop:700 length:456 start_codon:yes stop_codon:yes gene_type:complete